MATIGLSKPYAAIYMESDGVVTYSGGNTIGKAVQLTISLEDGGDNVLYADNAPAESANQFAGGELELTTDELSASVLAVMFNLTGTASTAVTTAEWYKYGDASDAPYMGFGAIRKKIVGGSTKYQAIVFRKIMFKNMDEDISTQGETIEWQTPTVVATILRDGTTTHDWKWVSSDVDTEAEALSLIQEVLGSA